VRLNAKGQVTIPAQLRAKHGLHPGDEVEVVEERGVLRIVRVESAPTRGKRLTERMRGRGSGAMTTDQVLALLRDE
jgi:AbrB family looped-hinge helix DNA binding protein